MRPPTAEEIAAAAKMTGDPIAANPRELRACRPAGPHKKPVGRPRKDGQPPHRTAAALEKEHAAAAAAIVQLTNEQKAATVGTPENLIKRTAEALDRGEIEPQSRFFADNLEKRLENLENTSISPRARTFLLAYANISHSAAMKAANIGPLQLHGFNNCEEFRRLYQEIRAAHDAATVARTCDTLADLANGEYKPKPNCLPPDMRAASLLMPALDQRFRAGQQGTSQQVQINIAI